MAGGTGGGAASEPNFAQLRFECLLERLQIRGRRLVTLLFRGDAHAAHLVEIPKRRLPVAESDVAADQGTGAGHGIDADGDATRAGAGLGCWRVLQILALLLLHGRRSLSGG